MHNKCYYLVKVTVDQTLNYAAEYCSKVSHVSTRYSSWHSYGAKVITIPIFFRWENGGKIK